ncbi:MAG: nuclear transport factor 2 (NTF2) superfamily protein [Paracoccaceae bacterium]|jgi:nuclear transport factor 2 (NTF2) superfamily protein
MDFPANEIEARKPLPPCREAAIVKIRLAEDAWNMQQPELIASAYSPDSAWRNHEAFIKGRIEIVQFLRQKWQGEPWEVQLEV